MVNPYVRTHTIGPPTHPTVTAFDSDPIGDLSDIMERVYHARDLRETVAPALGNLLIEVSQLEDDLNFLVCAALQAPPGVAADAIGVALGMKQKLDLLKVATAARFGNDSPEFRAVRECAAVLQGFEDRRNTFVHSLWESTHGRSEHAFERVKVRRTRYGLTRDTGAPALEVERMRELTDEISGYRSFGGLWDVCAQLGYDIRGDTE